MARRIRRALTFANVCSFLALTVALGTGGAYAANTVFSTDIVDGQVKNADIAGNAITSNRIYPGSVMNTDIGADAVDSSKVADATLTTADLDVNSVASGEIANDAVNAPEVSAGAIGGAEIAGNSVNTSELVDGSVITDKIGINEVEPANIANNSITALEFAGGRSSGTITLNAGFVANGRCRDFGIGVPNAEPGDAVLFSINTSVPHGILLHGVRVSSDGVAVGKACNLTGAGFPQLDDIQVAIVTFTL